MTDPNTPRNEDDDEILPPVEGAEEENTDEIELAAEDGPAEPFDEDEDEDED